MKLNSLFVVLALLATTACGSSSKDTSDSSTMPAPVVTSPAPAAPAPAAEAAENETQACEGKAAKDACSFGDVKGTCVRSATYVLKCTPKKSKK